MERVGCQLSGLLAQRAASSAASELQLGVVGEASSQLVAVGLCAAILGSGKAAQRDRLQQHRLALARQWPSCERLGRYLAAALRGLYQRAQPWAQGTRAVTHLLQCARCRRGAPGIDQAEDRLRHRPRRGALLIQEQAHTLEGGFLLALIA